MGFNFYLHLIILHHFFSLNISEQISHSCVWLVSVTEKIILKNRLLNGFFTYNTMLWHLRTNRTCVFSLLSKFLKDILVKILVDAEFQILDLLLYFPIFLNLILQILAKKLASSLFSTNFSFVALYSPRHNQSLRLQIKPFFHQHFTQKAAARVFY